MLMRRGMTCEWRSWDGTRQRRHCWRAASGPRGELAFIYLTCLQSGYFTAAAYPPTTGGTIVSARRALCSGSTTKATGILINVLRYPDISDCRWHPPSRNQVRQTVYCRCLIGSYTNSRHSPSRPQRASPTCPTVATQWSAPAPHSCAARSAVWNPDLRSGTAADRRPSSGLRTCHGRGLAGPPPRDRDRSLRLRWRLRLGRSTIISGYVSIN